SIIDTTDSYTARQFYNQLVNAFDKKDMYSEKAKILKKKLNTFESYHGQTSDLRDLGLAYAYAEEYPKADETFQKLLKKDSTYVYGYFMRAQINSQEGMDQAKAKELYEKVLDMS